MLFLFFGDMQCLEALESHTIGAFFLKWGPSQESYIHRLITVISQQAKWYEAKKYQIKGLLHLIYTPKVQHFIMLQKLSKCEVKAWLCWHLIILPPLWFYVKSNFGEFKWSKNVIFGNFRDSELWIFGKFGTWKLLKFAKIKIENL